MQKNQNIEATYTPETTKGVYSNVMMVHHNKDEFVLDFFILSPQPKVAVAVSRVIVSPVVAKKLAELMAKEVKNYELETNTTILTGDTGLVVM